MPEARVCMLSAAHSALDNRIFHKESRSLKEAGYEVTFITTLDNDGFFLDMALNRLPYRHEFVLHGINITGFTIAKARFPKVSAVSLLMMLASGGRLKLEPEPFRELINKGIKLSSDIYHCHDLWALYAGIQIKRNLERQGKKPKLIHDVHEFLPASETFWEAKNLRQRLSKRVFRKIIVHFEKEALKYVDYVITAGQVTRGYLVALNRGFIPTEVIYNCPVLSIFKEPEARETRQNKITICHDGYLPFRRGLKQMVEVMRILKERYDNKVELLISGDVYGEERKYLEAKLEEYDLYDTIRCTGWQPYEKVGEAIAQGDIGIIFFEPAELNMLAGPPHKLFNYMGCGLPIVSVDVPETGGIIRDTECGLIVRERSANSLAEALSTLIDDEGKRRRMGENGKRAVHNQYSWAHMETRLLRVYAELLGEV